MTEAVTADAPAPTAGAPLTTWALCAVLAVAFALELAGGDTRGFLTPTPDALVGMGALYRPLLAAPGGRYRLLVAGLLHAGPGHLAVNLVALHLGGRIVEARLGRAWVVVIFTLGLLAASGGVLVASAPTDVWVGGPGAVVALLAAARAATLRRAGDAARAQVGGGLLSGLVLALLPLALAGGDRWAFGAAALTGAAAGLALGVPLGLAARRRLARPPAPRLARALAAGSALLLAAAGTQALTAEHEQARLTRLADVLAPPTALSKLGALDGGQAGVAARALRARYPRDPRVLYLSARVALEAGAPAQAESDLRTALAERELLRGFFADGRLEAALRAHLARVLLARGAEDEARTALSPSCAIAPSAAADVLPPEVLARLCAHHP